ncbi:MAG: TonB-dependent receptor [Bradyrhizobium sp.]|nr:TonB-dependent receptor [Bradyrhizobium sp.]
MVSLRQWLLLGSSIGTLLLSSAAFAQTVPTPAGEGINAAAPQVDAPGAEIVVTGSRLRPEAVQDVPVAVSVANADTIEKLHTTDLRALTALVPNLTVIPHAGSQQTPIVFMRGFGVVGSAVDIEPGIAIYVDDVYLSTTANSLADLFDTERVEVLRGPQSTLLGKNASAGAILVRRTRPNTTDFSAKVEAEYGSFNLFQAQALVNIPLIKDVLGVKVYGLARRRDGWARSISVPDGEMGGENRQTARVAVTFTPTSNFNLYLTGEYGRFDGQAVPERNITPSSGTDVTGAAFRLCPVFLICQNLVGRPGLSQQQFIDGQVSHNWRFAANADWTVLDAIKLTSISGFGKTDTINSVDIDASPLPILESHESHYEIKEYSQELRLQSVKDGPLNLGGRLTWLVGGYYNHSNAYQMQPLTTISSPTATPTLTRQAQRVVRQGKATFTHFDFDIIKSVLTVSGGVRHSWDDVRHDFSCANPIINPPPAAPTLTCRRPVAESAPFPALNYTQKRQDENTSFELSANYVFARNKMAYVRFAEGYRGGGFVGLPATLSAADLFPAPTGKSPGGFGPETSKSYEAGMKTEWFDQKLLLNLTVFSTTYSNLQRQTLQSVDIGGGTVIISNVTRNISRARMRGVELESFVTPFRGANIRASLGYVDPTYLSYFSNGVDRRNDPFPFVQKWTANISPSYSTSIGGKLFDRVSVSAKWDYRGSSILNTLGDPVLTQKAYQTVDAQIVLEGGRAHRYSLTAYVSNLTDKRYFIYGGISGGAVYGVDVPGRTLGLIASAKF